MQTSGSFRSPSLEGWSMQPLARQTSVESSASFQGSCGSSPGLHFLQRGTSFESVGSFQGSKEGRTLQPQLSEGFGLQQPQLSFAPLEVKGLQPSLHTSLPSSFQSAGSFKPLDSSPPSAGTFPSIGASGFQMPMECNVGNGGMFQKPLDSSPQSIGTFPSIGTSGFQLLAESKAGMLQAPTLDSGNSLVPMELNVGTLPAPMLDTSSCPMPSESSMDALPASSHAGGYLQMQVDSTGQTSPVFMDIDSSSSGTGLQPSKVFGVDSNTTGLVRPKGLQPISLGVSLPSIGSFQIQPEASLGSPNKKDQLQNCDGSGQVRTFDVPSIGSIQMQQPETPEVKKDQFEPAGSFHMQSQPKGQTAGGFHFDVEPIVFQTQPQSQTAGSFRFDVEPISLQAPKLGFETPGKALLPSEMLGVKAAQLSRFGDDAPNNSCTLSENLSNNFGTNANCTEFGNIFKGIDLSFASGILSRPVCACCGPSGIRPGRPLGDAAEQLPMLLVKRSPIESSGNTLETDLLQAFGAEGLQVLFDRTDAKGAISVGEGGLNHALMVALGNRLIKFTRIIAGRSEASEAQRLLQDLPEMAADPHAACPLGSYRCRLEDTSIPCELTIYPFHEGAKGVNDIIMLFERTHPPDPMRGSSCCPDYCQGLNCKHQQQLQSLVKQVAGINRRFQARYGRRHGDFKANNVLVNSQGSLILVDLLNDSMVTCDREEFTRSLSSAHPFVAELRQYFQQACEWWQSQTEASSSEGCDGKPTDGQQQQADLESNLELVTSLEGLQSIAAAGAISPWIALGCGAPVTFNQPLSPQSAASPAG